MKQVAGHTGVMRSGPILNAPIGQRFRIDAAMKSLRIVHPILALMAIARPGTDPRAVSLEGQETIGG